MAGGSSRIPKGIDLPGRKPMTPLRRSGRKRSAFRFLKRYESVKDSATTGTVWGFNNSVHADHVKFVMQTQNSAAPTQCHVGLPNYCYFGEGFSLKIYAQNGTTTATRTSWPVRTRALTLKTAST